jgi:hypothetical protein
MNSTELRDIFLHHIILFFDITEHFDLLKYEENPFYKKNWYKHSKCEVKIWDKRKGWRVNGPAIEIPINVTIGDKYWYCNGKLHREDGPAVEQANNDKYWYVNGKLHREDGPAIEYSDGGREWYINGKLHREDGPAIEWIDGYKEWWVNGKHVKDQE